MFFCSPAAAKDSLVIGSRDFPESVLLAEILSSAVENTTDIKVDRKFNLGGVKVCVTAMQSSALDIYPDYTGSLMHNLLGEQSPDQYLRDYLATKLEHDYNFIITENLGFDNSFVLVLNKDLAKRYDLESLSDLQQLLLRQPEMNTKLRVAFKPSFLLRADGYKQLQKIYGFDFTNLRQMEYNIAYSQLKAGKIDIIDSFSTDARLLDSQLQILKDDRKALLTYDSVFVLRKDILSKYPELHAVLESLNASLDNTTILELNQRIARGETYKSVASSFLAERGLEPLKSSKHKDSRLMQDLPMLLKALKQHLTLSILALILGVLCGVSIGVYISYNKVLADLLLTFSSVIQVIPSLAMLALLIPVFGLGFKPALAALFLYSLLPIIQNTYTGIKSIAPEYIELAKSLALSPWQMITKVQLMLAAPTIIAGIRISAVICVGAATLATFVGAGGLGDLIKAGIDLNSSYLIALGAVPAALITFSIRFVLLRLERQLLLQRSS